MKNYIIYISLFFLSISCNSSKNIVKTDSVKFKLPENAVKIEKTALNQFPKIVKNFEHHKDIYKVNEIYIGLTPIKQVNYAADRLKRLKGLYDDSRKEFDLLYGKSNDHYKSSLKKINKNEVFIKYKYSLGIGEYYFVIVNNNRTKGINGSVIFEKESDYNQANKILRGMLNSFEFQEK